ncbi:MAG: MBL fold metallo-hydrolase [Synergistaceae bacterium]|nr:MBL fold metallo-hydrolase [Synergistaceae bacterium]
MKYRRFPLGGLWTNGYLFYDDGASENAGEAFFVDPGGDVGEVVDFLEAHKLTLKAVLLTHGHLDHIAGIEGLIPLVGDRIYISSADAPHLKSPSQAMQMALGMQCNGVEAFRTVADGDALSLGAFSVGVMATPGHTQGSVCYLIRLGEAEVLVSGDTLFAQSVGRTDLPGGDPGMLDASLRKLATLPDALAVLPGHGPETTIGRERKSNPFWPY